MQTEAILTPLKMRHLLESVQQISKIVYTTHNENDLITKICETFTSCQNIEASWITLTDGNFKIINTKLAGNLNPEHLSLYYKTKTSLISELVQILQSKNNISNLINNKPLQDGVFITSINYKSYSYGLLFITSTYNKIDEIEQTVFKNIGQMIGEAIHRIRHQIKYTESINKEIGQSNNLIEMLIDSIPSGFLMIGEDYKIYKANKQTCKSTGYTKEQLLGNYCDLICPKGPVSKECPIWAKGATSFRGMDTYIKGVNDNLTPIYKNAHVIQIKDKKYILESFIDISTLKKTEQELIKAKEKAERSERLKTSFLANMSHEIRTPINAILGLSDVLKRNMPCLEENMGYIDVIQKSAERMINTINDIVDISKIETNLVELSFQEMNIAEYLENLYTFFTPQLNHTNIVLLLELDRDIKITTDPDKLNTILINLLKNALKFTTKGYIKFGYKTFERDIEFFVKDTGIGIKEKYQKVIFERFIQADNSNSKRYEGSGLGLSIAKSYTDLLGGHMRVESEPDSGSCFYVTLPI